MISQSNLKKKNKLIEAADYQSLNEYGLRALQFITQYEFKKNQFSLTPASVPLQIISDLNASVKSILFSQSLKKDMDKAIVENLIIEPNNIKRQQQQIIEVTNNQTQNQSSEYDMNQIQNDLDGDFIFPIKEVTGTENEQNSEDMDTLKKKNLYVPQSKQTKAFQSESKIIFSSNVTPYKANTASNLFEFSKKKYFKQTPKQQQHQNKIIQQLFPTKLDNIKQIREQQIIQFKQQQNQLQSLNVFFNQKPIQNSNYFPSSLPQMQPPPQLKPSISINLNEQLNHTNTVLNGEKGASEQQKTNCKIQQLSVQIEQIRERYLRRLQGPYRALEQVKSLTWQSLMQGI